jgi:hypothetical protein
MSIEFITLPMPEPNPLNKETYLGDGLYISWDGWQIQLRAPREDGDHFVYLEPAVQAEFVKFIESIRR